MKKSVILILSAIYVLAIVFVGQMIKTEVYNPISYVTEIEVLNEDFEYYSDDNRLGNYYGKIVLDYVPGIEYELKCRAIPYTATTTLLTYLFDDESNICDATVTEDNSLLLNFNSVGPFPVTVKASDGSGVQIEIFIEAQESII